MPRWVAQGHLIEVMLVTVWNRVTADFHGRSAYGSYVIENDTSAIARVGGAGKA
jgi:hypothetical protein